jgi:hypothetical protein
MNCCCDWMFVQLMLMTMIMMNDCHNDEWYWNDDWWNDNDIDTMMNVMLIECCLNDNKSPINSGFNIESLNVGWLFTH